MEKFENLLDKHGRKFRVKYKGDFIEGRVIVGEVVVWLIAEGSVWAVGHGKPNEIEAIGLTDFRLLEPESKEGNKCPDCNGKGKLRLQGSIKGEGIRDWSCPACYGTGTIKKEKRTENPFILVAKHEKEIERLRGVINNLNRTFSEETLTKRENISTQLLAGMLSAPLTHERQPEGIVKDAIELTDLLLSKLESK